MGFLFASSVQALEDLTFISEEYPPFNYRNIDGEFDGVAVEILELMFKELNINKSRKDIKIFPWARGYAMAQVAGQKNVLFTTARLEEREDLFKWVGPFSGLHVALFSKQDGHVDIKSDKDLTNYRYVIVRKDLSEIMLRSKGLGDQHIILVSDVKEAVQRVLKGRADCFAHNNRTLHKTLRNIGVREDLFKKVYDLSGKKSYFAFNKSVSDETVKAYQLAFDKVTEEPTVLETLYDKHTQ